MIPLPSGEGLLSDGRGSVASDGSFSESRDGTPGVWIKEVVVTTGGAAAEVVSSLAPLTGKVTDLIRPAVNIVEDPRVDDCRKANPDNAPAAAACT